KTRPPPHVEEYRLSAEERRALAALVRQVDFFEASEPEPRGGRFDGPTLRISLDGETLAREKLDERAFAPLTNWFRRFVEQTRLLRDLRKGQGVRVVAQALGHDGHQVARRTDFRAPLIEFAETCGDPKELLVALGALAPLEDPAPWGALALRRAAGLDADAEFALLDGLLRGAWETEGRVTGEHRAVLFPRALAALRARTRAWNGLERDRKHRVNDLVNHLARHRFEPLFAALPEMAREAGGEPPALGLPLHFWGERGFDAALALLSSPDEGLRRSAVRLMPAFRYDEAAGRHDAEHPVPSDERARVRARLLAEGLARLDAMGEDAAEGHDGRRLAREEAKGIRRRSQPAEPVKRNPPGLSIRVVSEDGSTMPGVRVSAVPVARGGGPDRAGRAEVVRKSGADGVALFGELAPGDWEFDVDEPVLMRTRVSACRPYREGLSVQLNLRVRKQVTLSGRLVGNSGRVLAGAAVRRFRADGTPFGLEDESISDADGRVVLPENRDPGSGRIRVLLPDGRTFLLEERYLTDGRDWVVDFGPAGDGGTPPSVTGRVVGPDGSGLSAFVAAVVADTTGPAVATTGSRPDGTFEIYGLPPGAYRIWGNYRGRTGSSLGKGVTWWVDVPAVPARDVTLEIPLGERIEGRAVNPSGKPLVGVYLLAERRETQRAPHGDGPGSVPA
ncbi:MAG TPA: carboxypeptidase-like regulatory domain-containing protein, partial [Planctomycetota bacterium]|nr:carboxypeptidase-like regulatory domain-containing protein [Planctomycetota bacterium]